MVSQVEGLDPVSPGHLQALGHQVDAEDLNGALVPGDPGAHLTNWAQAEHSHAAAGGDPA